jgi:hypothetical protein
MEIRSLASQALVIPEQMTQLQMGMAALKQAGTAQKQVADMLDGNAKTVEPTVTAQEGGFSTYA